mmetsp:Transcript_48365/g.104799  ORF Transcript_48365/g.104799 Transcript_48365/m.104799 type:complete len:392 (+) Transcript_48365:618-1793(+)
MPPHLPDVAAHEGDAHRVLVVVRRQLVDALVELVWDLRPVMAAPRVVNDVVALVVLRAVLKRVNQVISKPAVVVEQRLDRRGVIIVDDEKVLAPVARGVGSMVVDPRHEEDAESGVARLRVGEVLDRQEKGGDGRERAEEPAVALGVPRIHGQLDVGAKLEAEPVIGIRQPRVALVRLGGGDIVDAVIGHVVHDRMVEQEDERRDAHQRVEVEVGQHVEPATLEQGAVAREVTEVEQAVHEELHSHVLVDTKAHEACEPEGRIQERGVHHESKGNEHAGCRDHHVQERQVVLVLDQMAKKLLGKREFDTAFEARSGVVRVLLLVGSLDIGPQHHALIRVHVFVFKHVPKAAPTEKEDERVGGIANADGGTERLKRVHHEGAHETILGRCEV